MSLSFPVAGANGIDFPKGSCFVEKSVMRLDKSETYFLQQSLWNSIIWSSKKKEEKLILDIEHQT